MLEENRSRRGRRSEEFIRSRPMTLQEQARLLLDALRRVLVDLDTIATGSLEALDPRTFAGDAEPDSKADTPGAAAPRIESISFEPDEGSTAPAINANSIFSSPRSIRLAELFNQLAAELDS